MTYAIPKFIKFGELSYKEGSIRARITDIKWGKYKDCDGNEVDFQRGNGKVLKISKYLQICSVHSPALNYGDDGNNIYTLYVWGKRENYDSESARRSSSDMKMYKAFLDMQKVAIDDEDTEVQEEKEPVVSQELEIEESRDPNF